MGNDPGRLSPRSAETDLQFRPGPAEPRRYRIFSTSQDQPKDNGPLRLSQLWNRRHFARLPLRVQLLHHYQRAGTEDARTEPRKHCGSPTQIIRSTVFLFFTDDNFARKKLWRETFEAIIKLREEGLNVSFMMQVDLARKPKDFVGLAAKAGCTQVFIGMESVNPENLKAEGKKQNNVEEYRGI
jgi:hypothetical protein